MSSSEVHLEVNGGTLPPLGAITSNDHGSYVIIATWIFTCVSILFVGVRVALRAWTSGKFGHDSALIVIALVFAIAQSALAQESVHYGLGKHRDVISNTEFRSFTKSIYVGQILSIFVFVWSKLSLVVVFGHVTPWKSIKIGSYICTAFIVLCGIESLIAASLQCDAGYPISSDHRCISKKAFFYTDGITNIISDVFIIILPIFIIWRVQISNKKRIVFICMFWPRISVIVTKALELSTLGPYFSGTDPTWNYLIPNMWDQISTHLSVITACIPLIKPFLDSMQSSLVDSGIPRNFSISQGVTENDTRDSHVNTDTSRQSRQSQSQRHSRILEKRASLTGKMVMTRTSSVHQLGSIDNDNSLKDPVGNTIHVRRDVDITVENA